MTEQAGLARHSDGVLLFTPSLELNITRQFHGKIVYAFLFGEIRNIEKNASSLSSVLFNLCRFTNGRFYYLGTSLSQLVVLCKYQLMLGIKNELADRKSPNALHLKI